MPFPVKVAITVLAVIIATDFIISGMKKLYSISDAKAARGEGSSILSIMVAGTFSIVVIGVIVLIRWIWS